MISKSVQIDTENEHKSISMYKKIIVTLHLFLLEHLQALQQRQARSNGTGGLVHRGLSIVLVRHFV